MKITFISDTHNSVPELDQTDVLVHCGDATTWGTEKEINDFFLDLADEIHKNRIKDFIFVPGNHDILFESDFNLAKSIFESAMKLNAEGCNARVVTKDFVEISGKIFFCYSYMKTYGRWAFMKSEHELFNDISRIPLQDGVDVLVTHSPAKGMMDTNLYKENCGTEAINFLRESCAPKIHAFGHIHECYGVNETFETTHINASMTSHAGCIRKSISVHLF